MPDAYAPDFNRDVVVLAYDRLCTFEFGIAVEFFALDRPEMGEGWYRCAVAGVGEGPYRATGGVTIAADGGLELLESAGTIVLPGWNGTPPPKLLDALRAAHERGARIVAICSGAFLLAETGLLDGKRATTHWRHAEAFAERFPRVTFAPDVLYVDEGSLMSSAGSSAGIDLCLHLVRRDYGADAANTVARRLVAPAHRDGHQRQFVERPVPRDFEAGRLTGVIDHVRRNLDTRIGLEEMAAMAGMSRRTFIRRFTEAVGAPPGRWIAMERAARARDLLETTSAPVKEIAALVGYGEAAALRHSFRKQFGLSPAAHRRQFGVAAQ